MCICKCFGWALDFIQRVLTFALACIMAVAICIGVTVAIGAGIAYGYNYMLAEFLTLSRTDLSVYVRRGQFYDKPDFGPGFRRKGDLNDLLTANASDYQDNKIDSDSKPLSETWRKAVDTRKYAEKLTKYSRRQFESDNLMNNSKFSENVVKPETATLVNHSVLRVYSNTPKAVMPTSTIPERTRIIMRKFGPIDQMAVSPDTNALEAEFYQDEGRTTPVVKQKEQKDKTSESKKSMIKSSKNIKKSLMKDWTHTKSPHVDYPVEELDEDNIVYKPI